MYKTDEIFEDKEKENMINTDEAEWCQAYVISEPNALYKVETEHSRLMLTFYSFALSR